nr:immunoglobulin light chain junction region [Macaca mulatta]MOX98953.1 immunoglobulin light chain junction region [Macaca mulatta]MOX99347.1 immunoglobulin light chain junction region [Macaca mulatta]MOY00489.1 immunoglobulin light chain junction region [Macaca mulatta]
CLQGYVTPFTF